MVFKGVFIFFCGCNVEVVLSVNFSIKRVSCDDCVIVINIEYFVFGNRIFVLKKNFLILLFFLYNSDI